jgi:hypothetical protein
MTFCNVKMSLAMLEETLIHTKSWQIGITKQFFLLLTYTRLTIKGLSDQGHEGR